MGERATWATGYRDPSASGAVEAAEEGAALGVTDAGGREQHGQTQAAIMEALRLALLAEDYDALAADTLSHAAGVEASVGLAQVVGGAVGDSKDGEAPGGGGITYGRRYYIADHLGSVRVVVTTSGTVVEARDYYTYGLMMPGRVFVQGQETREGYTGHELDAETGMYYAGARYYMPALGRWTAVDPLAESFPAWSPYNYVMNSPVGLVDPDGMAPENWYLTSSGKARFNPRIRSQADLDRRGKGGRFLGSEAFAVNGNGETRHLRRDGRQTSEVHMSGLTVEAERDRSSLGMALDGLGMSMGVQEALISASGDGGRATAGLAKGTKGLGTLASVASLGISLINLAENPQSDRALMEFSTDVVMAIISLNPVGAVGSFVFSATGAKDKMNDMMLEAKWKVQEDMYLNSIIVK